MLVARLVSALAADARITVFFTFRDPSAPQLTVSESEVAGTRVVRVVQNYPHRRLEQALTDPAFERIFARQLKKLEPDIVHFHHLAFMPLTLPEIAAATGAPTFLTLHDYFLVCPSGGQLAAHPDGLLCDKPDEARCGLCYEHYRQKEGQLEALALGLGRLPFFPPDLPFRLYRALPARLKGALKGLNLPTLPTDHQARVSQIRARRTRVQELFQGITLFIAPSRDLAARLEGWGLPPDRLELVPNPGPAKMARSPLPPKPPLRLLFLGTPAPHKGLEEVVAAVGHFSPAEVQLEVCGDMGIFPGYTSRVRRIAGPNVRFSGLCPPERVGERLGACHALVLGSRWPENAPLTVLEARAAGRPIIAPRIGGIPEQVEEKRDGLLYEPSAPGALVHLLQCLLAEPQRLEALHRTVQPPPKLQWYASRMMALYEQALEAKRPRSSRSTNLDR